MAGISLQVYCNHGPHGHSKGKNGRWCGWTVESLEHILSRGKTSRQRLPEK